MKPVSMNQLTELIDTLTHLLGTNQFSTIGYMMEEEPIEVFSPEEMIAMLRVTFTARTLIPGWHDYLCRVVTELSRRSLPTKQLLVGLIRPGDSDETSYCRV